MVALGIELSATRLSAEYGQPALDYLSKSGTSESNREPRAPKAGVLPSAPVPDQLVTRVGVEPNLLGLKDR